MARQPLAFRTSKKIKYSVGVRPTFQTKQVFSPRLGVSSQHAESCCEICVVVRMPTGAAAGRRTRDPRSEKVLRVSDEEKSVVEAASRTPDLLRHLNLPLEMVSGSLRFTGKLGSIAVAALKLLLHVFSYVGTDPATRQLSMQQFGLPRFVPPSPPPPVQPAWTTQTVSVVMETVAYAQHLAGRAAAAIALSAQAISETEMMMMQYEGLVEAAVSPPPPPPLHRQAPAPRRNCRPCPVRQHRPCSVRQHRRRRCHPAPHAFTRHCLASPTIHARVHLHLHHAPSPRAMLCFKQRPKRKLGGKCSANFQHPLHALSTSHPLDPLATLGAQADRERALTEELRLARLELNSSSSSRSSGTPPSYCTEMACAQRRWTRQKTSARRWGGERRHSRKRTRR